MFHLTKYALVVVFIYAPSDTFGKVSLESVEVKTFSSITCRFDVDIKIEFFSETDDKRYTIAACKTSQQRCFLEDQISFGKHYAVSYQTGNVTLFNILNDVEETRGTYYFCAIYPPVDCVKENISSPLRNSIKNDTIENKYTCAKDCTDNSATSSAMVAVIILLACLLCGTVFYILKLKKVLSWLYCSVFKTASDRTARLENVVPQRETVGLLEDGENALTQKETLDEWNEYSTLKTLQDATHQSNPVPTTSVITLDKESNGPNHVDSTASDRTARLKNAVPQRETVGLLEDGEKALTQKANCSDEEFNRLANEAWFFGVLPRKEIEPLLTQDGDFLVRESTSNPKYVLSVFWKGPPPQHIKIIENENGWSFVSSSEDASKTVTELVKKYVENKKPIAGFILSNPIQKESWQLKDDQIKLNGKIIGNNKIYEVFRGDYTRSVAVKKCKNDLSVEQRKRFLENGLKLNHYDHPNIVKFLGIVAQREPVMVIMEYMSGGSLLQYLQKRGHKQSRLQAAIMCRDVANGMAFLSEKGYVHRELSAKKCLIGKRQVVKISPFETFRQEGEYKDIIGNMKWTAPEAARRGKWALALNKRLPGTYDTMSDVWSFGVLMWEVLSNGSEPYPTFSDDQTLIEIEKGNRMRAPQNTPASIYELMVKCWEVILTIELPSEECMRDWKH